jgi:hypothetical protein
MSHPPAKPYVPIPLTPEEIEAGVRLLPHIPLSEMEVQDISDKHIDKMAQGFILGSKAIGRRKEIRGVLEDKVIKRIGHKGKYLIDKLFELIDGVYMVDGVKGTPGEKGSSIRYYKVPPSLPAITYALDRVLGKPVAKVEKTEEKKGLILVQNVIMNMANNPYKNGKRGNEDKKDIGGGVGSSGDSAGEQLARAVLDVGEAE